MKIVHFIGASKPWHVQFDQAGQPLSRSGEEHANKHLMYWWQIFHSDVSNKQVTARQAGSYQPDFGAASGHRGGGGPAHGQSGSGAAGAAGSSGDDRRERWEVGQPDYMGSASFDNILKKLESTMSTPGECETRLSRIIFLSLRQPALLTELSHRHRQ